MDENMERRYEKLRNVLATLKDGISSLPVKDPRSLHKIEAYLSLINLALMEVDKEERKYRGWLDCAYQNQKSVTDEALKRLRDYRRKMGTETDEEIIDEVLRVVEVRSR